MEFEWEPAKRKKTLKERQIDFVDILPCFDDPNRQVKEDTRKDYGETRLNMIAKCEGQIFHVTFTMRRLVTRIISARKAGRREMKRHEQI